MNELQVAKLIEGDYKQFAKRIHDFLEARNLGYGGQDMLKTLFDYVVELENKSHPLHFPPLLEIRGVSMEVDSVILFPLGDANHYYHHRDPEAIRPVLVEVYNQESSDEK